MQLAARFGEAAVSFGTEGMTMAETLPLFRKRMARLDDLCLSEGREPGSLRRGYLAGFASEAIFSSRESTADFVGRFAEAGVTDFVFALFNPAQPAMEAGQRTGQYCTREQVETLTADVLPGLRDAPPTI